MKPVRCPPSLRQLVLLISACLVMINSCMPTGVPLGSAPSEPVTIQMTANSSGPASGATIQAATVAPLPSSVEITPAARQDGKIDPVILIGLSQSTYQRCGHGDVVAVDGHILRSTPRVLPDNSNFLEKLPESSRVDIIDCRLWTDEEDISWLAVRTAQHKLGWMFLQDDKFNVTVYPVVGPVPNAVTGLPSGSRVAYVPPSNCQSGAASTEAVATSIGIDLLPVVGDLKGLGEAATGCDMVTGESLGNWRWLGLLGLVGLSEIALVRHADEVGDAARLADNARFAERISGSLTYSDEATMALLRNADTAADFRKGVSQLDSFVERDAVSARYFNNGGELSDEAIRALAKFDQPCSFSAETPVQTASGLQPISHVQPGDWVLAYDEANRRQGWFTVSAAFQHADPVLLRIQIGAEVVETTPEHPFFVAGAGWTAAGSLQPGQQVVAANGGSGLVGRLEVISQPETMYNLTVAGAHTYYVGQGGWLVHNACSRVLRSNLYRSTDLPGWAKNDEIEWQAHHIIPGQYEDHAFLKSIHWDIDSAENGIALPTRDIDAIEKGLPAHRGSHSDYSSQVKFELDNLFRQAEAENWSEARRMEALRELIASLRRALEGSHGRLAIDQKLRSM